MMTNFKFRQINCKGEPEKALSELKRLKKIIEVAKKLGATINITRSTTQLYSNEFIEISESETERNEIDVDLNMVDGIYSGKADESEIEYAIKRIEEGIEIKRINTELMDKIEEEMEHVENTT